MTTPATTGRRQSTSDSAPFQVQHHATMMGDRHRLAAYRAALTACVRNGDCVVDAGTGTAILASYAAMLTSGPVYGVEYFAAAAALAERMVRAAGLANVTILNENTFRTTITPPPDVLVTETVGALGPEENIVELTHDFVRRHPTVRHVLPASLAVLAVPVRSAVADHVVDRFLSGFVSASHGEFSYDAVADELRHHAGRHLFTTDLSGSTVAGEETELVRYELGRSETSSFEATVRVDPSEANAVHLFFRCALTDEIAIESHLSAPPTHWRHSFVWVPPGLDTLRVRYEAATRRFTFDWPDNEGR